MSFIQVKDLVEALASTKGNGLTHRRAINKFVVKAMMEANEMMEMENDFANLNSIEELVHNAKDVKDLIAFEAPRQNELKRRKRETASTDCKVLQSQLVTVQNDTAQTTNKLNKTTTIRETVERQIFDTPEEIASKVETLVDLILTSKHIVVHTGAGISTSCGIPDFRGPNGVWTLEKQGIKPKVDVSFKDAVPSKTHRALQLLVERGFVKFIISQNIDGLQMRARTSRKHLAELHGNMFTSECPKCKKQFVRSLPVPTVGRKTVGVTCRNDQRPCRGQLIDSILDWEDNLPDDDLDMAIMHSTIADLHIGLGSSFQIMPNGKFPLSSKKFGGKFALINLQPIKVEKKLDLVIHS